MDGVYHDKWEKSSEPKWLNNPRCHMGPMYTNYAAFNTALQNPGSGDRVFWQEVPNYDYAVKNMKRKNPDIQAKFDSKNKHTGGAQIQTYVLDNAFAVKVCAPKAPRSRDHAYVFVNTDEIWRQWQLTGIPGYRGGL